MNHHYKKLYLYNCSLTASASLELVQSLSMCKHLTELNLGENTLGEAGHQLAQSIRCWGDEPSLQKLNLLNCSFPTTASLKLVQSLSTCRNLTKLQLGGNRLEEAGLQLAQSIRSWGDEPPLQKLGLYNCSLTVAASLELIEFLSTCKQLTLLDLGDNKLGEAGHQLAQSIKSWGGKPPLQQLGLHNCSLTVTASLELVQSLSKCRNLTELQLGGNTLGEAGHQLAESIRSWGDKPPLQKLRLYNCSFPATASLELVQSLILCKHLEFLDLIGNEFDETGFHLAHSLRSSVQYVCLPDGPTVAAAQSSPPVTRWRKGISDDDDTSSYQSNDHYSSDNSNSEIEVYSETEDDKQFENEGIADARNAIAKNVQGPRYQEDMTEFGIKIRRYEDERVESLVLTSLDSVVAGAVGVVGNLSLGDNAADKYPMQELQVINIMYFTITNNTFSANSHQIVKILRTKT